MPPRKKKVRNLVRSAGFDSSTWALKTIRGCHCSIVRNLFWCSPFVSIGGYSAEEIRINWLWGQGSPKIVKNFFGVSPTNLKKVVVLPGAAKGFCLRQEAAPGGRCFAVPRLPPFSGGVNTPKWRHAKSPLFSKFWAEPLRKFSKF